MKRRYNPFTKDFYSPPETPHGRESLSFVEQLDKDYVLTLSDSIFVRRLCYRSLIIYFLKGHLQELDGLCVSQRDTKIAGKHVQKFKKAMSSVVEEIDYFEDQEELDELIYSIRLEDNAQKILEGRERWPEDVHRWFSQWEPVSQPLTLGERGPLGHSFFVKCL